MNKSDLVELKYLSEISKGANIWSLTDIVSTATTANASNNITGILCFDQGHFGQILEGTREAVEDLWEKIKNDDRHQNIELLGINEIKERRFPEWSMRLFSTQEFAEAFPQFSDLINKMKDPDAKMRGVLKELCRNF